MSSEVTQADLEAYVDEALSPTEMAVLEGLIRQQPQLMQRLRTILGRRDAGVHSLGEIWRRHRLSCPDREILGSYLLGVLEPEQHDFVEFHLRQVGCRFCTANLADLQTRQQQLTATERRRQRYFQSSAGLLRHKR